MRRHVGKLGRALSREWRYQPTPTDTANVAWGTLPVEVEFEVAKIEKMRQQIGISDLMRKRPREEAPPSPPLPSTNEELRNTAHILLDARERKIVAHHPSTPP